MPLLYLAAAISASLRFLALCGGSGEVANRAGLAVCGEGREDPFQKEGVEGCVGVGDVQGYGDAR